MVEKSPTVEEQEFMLGENGFLRYFNKINVVLKKYMDMREEYYQLVSLWIMGSYLHKQFSAYPYLFFNAMRGSGKTRVLKIIANLSKNGSVAGSMTEAVLFRTAYQRTLCIDEIEGINAKGNENLRLILNSAYKKGAIIERMDLQKKIKEGEERKPDVFKVYCPIALANITGMGNVLSDRCISIILEKSSRKEITRLIEDFENEIEFQAIKGGLIGITEKIGDELNYFGDVTTKWNEYVQRDVNYIIDSRYENLFQSINETNIEGRDLELFFPLFIVADMCGESILKGIIGLSKIMVEERHQQDREENIDIQIYEFIANRPNNEFVAVADLVKSFREGKEIEENQDNWLNSRFFGRALRRLNLVIAQRNTNKRQVRLDIKKAKEKTKLFIKPEVISNSELDEVFNE